MVSRCTARWEISPRRRYESTRCRSSSWATSSLLYGSPKGSGGWNLCSPWNSTSGVRKNGWFTHDSTVFDVTPKDWTVYSSWFIRMSILCWTARQRYLYFRDWSNESAGGRPLGRAARTADFVAAGGHIFRLRCSPRTRILLLIGLSILYRTFAS